LAKPNKKIHLNIRDLVKDGQNISKNTAKNILKPLNFGGFDDQKLCTEFALKFSEDNNIVKSEEWANLTPENGLDGLVITDEIRKKLSNSQKNSPNHSTRGKVRKEFSDKMKGSLNPFYGKTHSDETKLKLSLIAKNRSDETKQKMRVCFSKKRHYNNGIKSIFINPNDGIPEGYHPGRIYKRK